MFFYVFYGQDNSGLLEIDNTTEIHENHTVRNGNNLSPYQVWLREVDTLAS